ncbi:hypothetical protein GCM10009000_062250 [Halobacterium noricense]|uniref:Uncharacterized protein n=1 Tax=Haladaptatus pallidirubidus TaxID=1008152 RepID=A0AAV3UJE7_9EURY|nr:hypothetical protein [Haladaptatus pallidirubidus]
MRGCEGSESCRRKHIVVGQSVGDASDPVIISETVPDGVSLLRGDGRDDAAVVDTDRVTLLLGKPQVGVERRREGIGDDSTLVRERPVADAVYQR